MTNQDRGPERGTEARAAAEAVQRTLLDAGATCATAESLTGGLIGAHLTAIPGSSASYRGGVVAYATDTKASVLGVPDELLAEHGPVHPDVAGHMALGVRRLTRSDYAVAVTGVAGPEPQGVQPVGTVYVAVATPAEDTCIRRFRFTGNRAGIRYRTVEGALRLLDSVVRGSAEGNFRA